MGYAQQLPNSGFENWSLREEYIEPDGWISTNAFAYFGAPETCYPVEESRTGKWAMKLESRYDPNTGNSLQAFLAIGNSYDYAGIAFTHRPQSFSFYYKHNHRDTAIAGIFLTKWNTLLRRRDTLASAFTFFIDSTNTFTLRQMPLTWARQGNPDTCIAIFLSSLKAKPNPGNYLVVDDMRLDGFLGTELVEKESIVIYPNPTLSTVTINSNTPVTNIAVWSLDGRLLFVENSTSFSMAHLPPGSYMVKASLENGGIINKIVVRE